MDKLTDKLKVWHLILMIVLQLLGFVYAIGAKAEALNAATEMAVKNQASIKEINIKLFKMELLNERITSLNEKMTKLSEQIENLNKLILDIYKRDVK